jgi:CheY-like chemotaxis protein
MCSKNNVLIVEPRAERRVCLERILALSGRGVVAVASRSQALRALFTDAISVMITAADLPDGHWQDLLSDTAPMLVASKIIVVLSGADPALRSEVLNFGAYALVSEPEVTGCLLRIVESATQDWIRQCERPRTLGQPTGGFHAALPLRSLRPPTPASEEQVVLSRGRVNNSRCRLRRWRAVYQTARSGILVQLSNDGRGSSTSGRRCIGEAQMRRRGEVCLLLAWTLQTGGAFGATKHGQRLEDAATVLEEVMSTPHKAIPQKLLDKAHCVVIIPGLKKGAFIFVARYGKGCLTCRHPGGEGSSAPATVRVEGGSFGLQLAQLKPT